MFDMIEPFSREGFANHDKFNAWCVQLGQANGLINVHHAIGLVETNPSKSD